MRNMTSLFLLVLFHIVVIQEVLSGCHPYNQQLLVENYEGITNEFLIWKGLVTSRLECVHKCYYDFRCVTFQHSQSGECRKYAATLDVLKTWTTETKLGTTTYNVNLRDGFGKECTSDEDCHFPKSECRQSTCGCIIGYSFNPMENACTNGCTVYGSSYATFPSTGLRGFDIEQRGGVSLDECQKLCSSRTNCKTIDYIQSRALCILKWASVLDYPTKLMHPKAGVMLGVRNCYN